MTTAIYGKDFLLKDIEQHRYVPEVRDFITDNLGACDTCGEVSRLKLGMCLDCHRVYESNMTELQGNQR